MICQPGKFCHRHSARDGTGGRQRPFMLISNFEQLLQDAPSGRSGTQRTLAGYPGMDGRPDRRFSSSTLLSSWFQQLLQMPVVTSNACHPWAIRVTGKANKNPVQACLGSNWSFGRWPQTKAIEEMRYFPLYVFGEPMPLQKSQPFVHSLPPLVLSVQSALYSLGFPYSL